MNDNQNENIRL